MLSSFLWHHWKKWSDHKTKVEKAMCKHNVSRQPLGEQLYIWRRYSFVLRKESRQNLSDYLEYRGRLQP